MIEDQADESNNGTELGLFGPQSRHHAIPDRHDAADVPGILGHQPIMLPDGSGNAGHTLLVGSARDVPTPNRVVTQPQAADSNAIACRRQQSG
jgi:hypothetical protein